MCISAEYFLALLAIITISLFYFYTKLRAKLYKIEKFFDHFPNPPTLPILGNARDFSSPSAFLKNLHKYTKDHGKMVHIKIGPFGHVLVTSDYKFVEFLLTSNKLLKKSFNLRYLEPWIGKGLVTADGGPKWRMHRKLITPAFHFKVLEQFVDVFESASNILVKKLSEKSGSKSIDIFPFITRCTLDVICETALGVKIDAQNTENSSYFHSAKEMCRLFVVRTWSMLKANDFLFSFTEDYTIQQKSVKILHDYTNKIINQKRAERNEKRNDESFSGDTDDFGIKKKKVFLDLILDATDDGKSLSLEEIREEVDTFTFGGHDTTATATSFILYCLAENKEIQNRILEEQEQLFGNNKNPEVTYADLQNMKYLENVIKEGLRLYSPVPLFGREIDQEVEYDGMTIPKGVGVIVFSHGIHMNPEYYPNPEIFDPSRFERIDSKLPFSYIPFSAGPRNCIGQKYAMLELKSLVSKIVRNFELLPAFPKHNMELSAETVLTSLNGVKIGLRLRENIF